MVRDYADAAEKHRLLTQPDNWHPWQPEEDGDPETEDPFAGMFEESELRVIDSDSLRTRHQAITPPQPSLIKCPICLDEKPAHEFAALNCSHVFCTSPCFWQLKGKTCPICRQ